MAGGEQHRQFRCSDMQLPGKIDTAKPRHDDVCKYKIERSFLEKRQSLGSIAGAIDSTAEILQ